MTRARSEEGRWLAPLLAIERHPAVTIFGIGAVLLAAYLASLVLLRKPDGRIVMGDAVHYYVYVRSAVFDRDLAFQNEYIRLYGLQGGEPGTEWVYEPTATGLTRNMMAIGTPLAWAPLFLAGSAVVWLFRLAGADYPADGFGRLFQATAGVSGVLCGVLGAWLAYRLAMVFTSRRAAIWATLIVWLGSNAIYYTFVSPTYSHAVSMLALGALFLYWARTLDDQTPRRYAVLGVLVGLTSLVRWQDAVFLLVPFTDAMYVLWQNRRLAVRGESPASTETGDAPGSQGATSEHIQPYVSEEQRGEAGCSAGRMPAEFHHGLLTQGSRISLRRTIVNLAVCGVAAVVTFSPQIAVWMTLYAQPVAMPQGAGWMEWHAPHVWKVLFSDWHGLFTWSPVIAVSVIGFWALARRHPRVAVVMGAALFASWYGNGSVVEWWAGEAYGARRFVSCFPIFVVGAAAAFERWTPRVPALATFGAVVIAHNFLLLLQYQLFMHGLRTIAPYPGGAYGMWIARFVVPFELMRWILLGD